MAKLRSSLPVDEAAERHEAGESLRSLARAYGIDPVTLRRHLERAGFAVRTPTEARVLENKNRPRGSGSRGGKTQSEHVKKIRQKRIDIARQYRNEKGCERCGIKHPAVLDLHHRDPESKHLKLCAYKTSNGHKRVGRGWREIPLRDLQAELEKCAVLCANCHRIHEWAKKGLAEAL